MAAIELAKAYIQIVPTTKGIQGDLEAAMGSAGESAGKAGGKGLASGVGSAIGGVAKAAAAGIAAAGAGMMAFGKSSVDAGMEFDKSMSQVAATMGVTVDDIQELRDFAMEMGSKTAFSATEAADALNYMALAGYDSATSMRMLPNVLNLAAAGGIDLASASDMVTDASSALGLTIDETSVMIDQMAKASSKTNTSVAQLGDAILTIGGTAKDVKGGTAELSSVLGVLADNGIKGSEAGTHLRNIMLSLTPKTEEAAEAMEAIGLQAYDAEGELRPLNEVFLDLQAGLEGMSTQERQNTLTAIFNKTDLSSINALLSTTSDRWDELADSIGDADGAASAMAETQLDNLAGDITLFQSALEGAKIAVSDGLSPEIRSFVQFGTKGISQLTEAFQKDGLSGAVSVFADLVGEGVQMLLQKLPEFVSAGAEIFGAILNGILGALPTILEALPTMVTTFIDLFMQIASSIIEALPTIVEAIVSMLPTVLPELINGIVSLFLLLVENIGPILDPIIQALPDIINSITDALLDNLPQIIAGIVMLIGQIIIRIPQLLAGIWQTITHFFSEVWQRWLGPVLAKVGGFFRNIWNAVVEFFRPAIEWIQAVWQKIVHGFHVVFDPWIEIIRRLVARIKEKIITPIQQWFSAMWEKISGAASKAWQAIKTVFQPVTDWFKDKFSKAWEAVKRVFQVGGRIFDGIKEGIVNAFKVVVNGIIRGINRIIPIPFNALNAVLSRIHNIKILGVMPFTWVGQLNVPQIPELASGGVLERGQVGLLEGTGAEAVVPLERNTGWIRKVAAEMSAAGPDSFTDAADDMIEAFRRMQIVLDSNLVVGGIRDKMDQSLGTKQIIAGRGVATA